MEENNIIEVNKELQALNKEKTIYEYELDKEKEKLKYSLLGDMGKDIDAVLSGEKKVEISTKQKIKYKVRHILEKIFKLF